MNLDPKPALRLVDNFWEDRILPTLRDYIGIPNQSPCCDADWEDKGYMDDATGLVKAWCEKQAPRNAEVTLHTCAGRMPLLLVNIPGRLPGQALLYGHLDKQSPGSGWREGLSPWSPVREGDLLYGRGAADDDYAVFTCIGAIALLETQGIPFPRCVLLIECSEESGSQDLAYYLDRLQDRIGTPDLVVCLDSGCGNYEQLWVTTSLRGLIGGNLTVEVLREGVHSGDASGVVPSSFRIIRALLDRIEDPETGEVVEAFQVPVPPRILEQIRRAVDALGTDHFRRLPVSGELSLVGANTFENAVNRTWCPALEITGAGDLPPLDAAGNVLRPRTSLSACRLRSIRPEPARLWLEFCGPIHPMGRGQAMRKNRGPTVGRRHRFRVGSTPPCRRPRPPSSTDPRFTPARASRFPSCQHWCGPFRIHSDRRARSGFQCAWSQRISPLGYGKEADRLCRRDYESPHSCSGRNGRMNANRSQSARRHRRFFIPLHLFASVCVDLRITLP